MGGVFCNSEGRIGSGGVERVIVILDATVGCCSIEEGDILCASDKIRAEIGLTGSVESGINQVATGGYVEIIGIKSIDEIRL